MVKLSIILPTYNEKENIKRMIPELHEFLEKNRISGEIIVADDNSPDKTWKQAEEMKKKFPEIRVLKRKKLEGVGAALRDAYNIAKGDLILSMDADCALEVKEISRLLKGIDGGFDLVIGSRFMSKSKFQKTSLVIRLRGIISKWGNLYTSLVTLTPINDFSLNFRVMKKEVWKKIDPPDNRNFFLAEMAILAKIKGFKVKSVPVSFKERTYGQSKTRVLNQFVVFLFKTLKYAFFLQWLYK